MANIFVTLPTSGGIPLPFGNDRERELEFWKIFFNRNQYSIDMQRYIEKVSSEYQIGWIYNMFLNSLNFVMTRYAVKSVEVIDIKDTRVILCFKCNHLLEHNPG